MRAILKAVRSDAWSSLIAGWLLVSWPAAAGPWEDANAAYGRREFAEAARLLRPLAEQGDARAQSSLGFMYYEGLGAPRDTAEAAKLMRPASRSRVEAGAGKVAARAATDHVCRVGAARDAPCPTLRQRYWDAGRPTSNGSPRPFRSNALSLGRGHDPHRHRDATVRAIELAHGVAD